MLLHYSTCCQYAGGLWARGGGKILCQLRVWCLYSRLQSDNWQETLETNKSTAAVNQCAVTSWNSCRRREIWPFLIALFICVSSKNLWWFSTLGLSRCLRFLTSGSSRQSWNQQPEFRKTNEIFHQALWLQSRHYHCEKSFLVFL